MAAAADIAKIIDFSLDSCFLFFKPEQNWAYHGLKLDYLFG